MMSLKSLRVYWLGYVSEWRMGFGHSKVTLLQYCEHWRHWYLVGTNFIASLVDVLCSSDSWWTSDYARRHIKMQSGSFLLYMECKHIVTLQHHLSVCRRGILLSWRIMHQHASFNPWIQWNICTCGSLKLMLILKWKRMSYLTKQHGVVQ